MSEFFVDVTEQLPDEDTQVLVSVSFPDDGDSPTETTTRQEPDGTYVVEVVQTGLKGEKGDQGNPGIQGPPGLPGGAPQAYVHSQVTPENVWTITHGLGYNPNVTIVDSAGTEVIGLVKYIDINTIEVTFGDSVFGGKAYLS